VLQHNCTDEIMPNATTVAVTFEKTDPRGQDPRLNTPNQKQGRDKRRENNERLMKEPQSTSFGRASEDQTHLLMS
jgi:hypothetical protein